jgi:hypothetical protein
MILIVVMVINNRKILIKMDKIKLFYWKDKDKDY